jgi:hypothetical protein
VHRLAAHTLTAAVADVRAMPAASIPSAAPRPLRRRRAVRRDGRPRRPRHARHDGRVRSAATEHAGENLAAWVGARAETARTDRFLARLHAQAGAAERGRLGRGVTLLDPPRAGAGREVVDAVAALAPASVVYVACDPVALARDLGAFRERGYGVRRIDAFDLFPHSHHVEAVALLQREP